MTDDQQRARELIGQFLTAQGWAGEVAVTVLEADPREVRISGSDAIALVAAALRAAPEVTDTMVEAAHAAYWAHPDDSGEDRPCIRAALEAAFAARPQGVK